MPKWWDNLTDNQRRLVMIGVPVAAVAALVVTMRGGPDTDQRRPTAGAGGGAVQAPRDDAISAGEMGRYMQAFTEAIGDLGGRLADVETELDQPDPDPAPDPEPDPEPDPDPDPSPDPEPAVGGIGAKSLANIAAIFGGGSSSRPDEIAQRSGREAVVAGAYRDVLGRNPDPAGLAYWTSRGVSSSALRRHLEASPEAGRL